MDHHPLTKDLPGVELFDLGDENDVTYVRSDCEDREQEEKDLPNSTKAPRGLTTKAKIIKNRSEGIKLVLQYNDMGVMVGEVKTDLVSIIGILARTSIPITYDDWRYVPRHIKDKLHTLTVKYILPFKAKPEILEDPLAIYSFIKKDHWDQFVASRLSEKFTKTRKEQQKKRKKNKHDHRLSQKGYVGLIEEQDQLMQQYDEGSLQVVDSQDVLTMALGTPEHSGRVRVMGHFVTKRMYFDLPISQVNFQNDRTAQQIAELEAEIQSLKQQNATPKHSEVSSSNMPIRVCMDDQEMSILLGLETNVEGVACKLAIDCKENIVATGTIIEYKSSNCLVSIEVVFDRDADLLVAYDDESLVKVNDAVGHHAFWPKNLVIHTSKGGKFKNVDCNTQKISKIQQIVKISPSLKAFATLVDRCVTPSMDIVIKNDCDIFGYKCSTHISLDDCRHILSMVEIGVSCLNVYIRLLYDELKENEMAGQFGFINPASVSLSGGLANSKRSIEKSRMVAKGLENASQSCYVYIPYSPR
ncbi:hypothetical protein QYF36_024953 [Acer negundo]|nr:hypothetical protein QYF36_024953 [Acer negundo]